MAHNQRSAKKIIIDSLREVPFINHAVRKADISRTTFYRWLAKNKAFKYNVDAALKEGHKNMIEIAESVLLKKVKEGNVRAIEFYLENNS